MTLPQPEQPVYDVHREYRLSDWTVTLMMPKWCHVLGAGWRGTRPALFTKVNSAQPADVPRKFMAVRSGEQIPADGKFIDPVVSAPLADSGGGIVAYIYEVPVPPA